jgi:hypothetical protein
MTTSINPSVKQAVEEVKAAFALHAVNAVEDGEGGAFVQAQDLPFGDRYQPASGWVTFRIMDNYPHADIYPHYVTADLKRRDGKELGEGFSRQEMALGPFKGPAIQVSRRSHHWNPLEDTAALKLAKVLDWMRTCP